MPVSVTHHGQAVMSSDPDATTRAHMTIGRDCRVSVTRSHQRNAIARHGAGEAVNWSYSARAGANADAGGYNGSHDRF